MRCRTILGYGQMIFCLNRLVEELQVDLIQGFYYARPMPIPQFVEFVRAHNG